MKNYLLLIRTFLFTVLLIVSCLNLFSQVVYKVSSISGLQSAINGSSPGDTIILANGTYLNSNLTINKSGITVKAETPGGVFLNGTQNIVITGSNITFSGFQFTSGDIGEAYVIVVKGNHNILTQLNFNGYSAKKYIHITDGTQYNEISYCNIENKPVTAVVGCTIQISTSPFLPGYHRIRYCSFKNFPGPGGDYGNEPIRIGLSTEMTNTSKTIVEYCYFNNVGLGDSESISLKSCENVCRYNTFTNNPDGMMVFRHGYRNVAYGNFFINKSGGIRIKEGADHYIYNNYFETVAAEAITLQYVAEYPLKNVNFVHNTFVNMGKISLGKSGPTNVTFANNIFKKTSGNIFYEATGNETWIANIYYGTTGISAKPGLTKIDPLLEMNADGFYGLSATSPAINAASLEYPVILDIKNIDDDPLVLMDINGQSRNKTNEQKDIGCDEFTKGTVTNRPLKLTDVGPSYLGGPVAILMEQTINFSGLPSVSKGDTDFNPGAVASSELPVLYESSDTTVASVINGKINIKKDGTTFITAAQNGSEKYKPASEVSQKLVVTPQTAAIDISSERHNIYIYPNPAGFSLKLKTGYEFSGKSFRIISVEGKIRSSGTVTDPEQFIDIKTLPPGMYVLVLDDINRYLKFIKN